ncbi:uncharacterized protein [Amphiura filiformis]|uniref:uncharacterized protein n=1 Tax=Amphiura filiformis TaxID=82378 RepID=UPI003B2261E4
MAGSNILPNVDEFLDKMMSSTKYKEFLKSVITEVIDDKIVQRIEKCESDLFDLSNKVEALEIAKEESSVDKEDLSQQFTNVDKQLNDIQQYSRRNSLRVTGIPEHLKECTDTIVKDLAKEKLGITINDSDVDRSHRVGKMNEEKQDGSKKHRAILVKFTSYRSRNKVIKARSKLKGSGITIHEDLTKQNQILLSKTGKHPGVVAAWSIDGRIFASVPSSAPGKTQTIIIRDDNDFKKIPKVDEDIVASLKLARLNSKSDKPRVASPKHTMQTRNRAGSLK